MLSKESCAKNKIKNALWASTMALAFLSPSAQAFRLQDSLQQNLVEVATENPTPMPNIGYLASGYNIFYGNPLSQGVDPGFGKSSQIFDFDYGKKKVTDDLRYLQPDGVDIKNENKCTMSFSSSQMSSESDIKSTFQNTISGSVEGSYGAFSGAFRADATFNRMVNDITSSNSLYISSKAECMVYQANLNKYAKPAFHENFIAAVNHLSTNINDYYEFIDDFGTHYVTTVHMGAKFGYTSKLDRSKVQQLTSKGINLNTAAEASAWGVTVKAGY
jgi:hypothetical protein